MVQLPSQYRQWAQYIALFLASQVLGLICWSLVPMLGPILLDRAGATPAWIGIAVGTFPQSVTLILTPWISVCSDRTRTRFGRRLPYLWFSAPLMALALIVLGYGQSSILLCSGALLLFALASLVPSTLLYCLFPDVLPLSVMGRFMAWNGAGASLVAAGFHYWGLAWATEHLWASVWGGAGLYLLSMALLFLVREKDYVPVPLREVRRGVCRTVWEETAGYFRECFHDRLFVWLFLCLGLNQASMILRTMFSVLLATKDLEMSMGEYGRVSGVSAVLGAVAALGVGAWVDRSRPAKVYGIGSCLVSLVSLLGWFLVRTPDLYALFALLTAVAYAVQSTAYAPLLMSAFPAEKYGQYSSANSTISTLMVMGGASLGGWLTTRFGFRLMFLWDSLFTALGLLALVAYCRGKCSRDGQCAKAEE